jgi:mutator protein MutT
MEVKFQINVSVVILKSKKILLGKRSPTEEVYPNLWGIPGGKIDSTDTSLEDGLSREVKEEIGIAIKNIKLLKNNIRKKSNDSQTLYLTFKAEISEGTPRALEDTVEVKWFNFNEINPNELTPFTYDILKIALED